MTRRFGKAVFATAFEHKILRSTGSSTDPSYRCALPGSLCFPSLEPVFHMSIPQPLRTTRKTAPTLPSASSMPLLARFQMDIIALFAVLCCPRQVCALSSPPVSTVACVPGSDQSVTRRNVEVLRQPSTNSSSQVICVCPCRITMAYRSHVQPSFLPQRGVTTGFMRCTISTSQPPASRHCSRYSVAFTLVSLRMHLTIATVPQA